jgi:UDP-N-acetylmuramate dehydrogenase
MTTLQKQLKEKFSTLDFQFDFPLKNMTYIKIGGPAEVFIKLSNKDEIVELYQYCIANKIKLTIFGGGSNVVVEDKGISGVVLKIEAKKVELKADQGDRGILWAETGLSMSEFVKKSIEMGFAGLEHFAGVPGSLGGAIYNNAHYLAYLISDHIIQVEVITGKGEVKWLSNIECEFGYDRSRFHKLKEVILSAEFRLKKGDQKKSTELIREANRYRAETQPLTEPSSGCIFQNVPNTPKLKSMFEQFADKNYLPAGFLIDKAGLKNTKQGDIKVSEKHAAFMINLGNGTAEDVKILIEKVKARVSKKFGVELREEVVWMS